MATLQTIRSKGPLLVVVIGLALFAFIAGDAWKVLQPHQGKQDVGEINGKTLTAQEYQKMVDEYFITFNFTHFLSPLYTVIPSISAKRFALMKYTHLLSDV